MDDISSPDYAFGGFRLDTALQVLIAPGGEPLPLQSRAFATLQYLVERAGEIVEKSALMAAVWPTTVVAENNLNQCILALRKTLGESAGERRFILTVPGRGFKFVAPVTVLPHSHSGPLATSVQVAPPTATRGRTRGYWLTIAAALLAVLLVGAGLVQWLNRNRAVTIPAEYVQLTDVTDGAVSPVVSPDGHTLAFIRHGSGFRGSGQIWAKALPNGEPVKLTDAHGLLWAPAFTPDSAKIVYTAIDPQQGSWDTWTVPATGGAAATELLPNAQGLTYIGSREVLYSEFLTGIHLAVVTSREDRSSHRQVYTPAHERGMAHFSYLSPDRKSVLVVEMGATGAFGRCRVAPFDGGTPGYEVGPLTGACITAAWSPDGKWMYFSAIVHGGGHLWRQRFPRGEAEQITFGPNEEENVFASADGRSLLTAIGFTQSTLWLHKAGAERVLTTEGSVSTPWLSADAQRVYFLATRGTAAAPSLTRMDIGTGHQESLLPGFSPIEYDISSDERQVAITTERAGIHDIWIGSLDGHSPPRLLAQAADKPRFGGQYVFFRRIEDHVSFLRRIRTDGGSESQLLPDPIIDLFCAAPDGKAVVVVRAGAYPALGGAWLIPIDTAGPARLLNYGYSPSRWSLDGRTLYVGLNGQDHDGSTIALPTGADDLPLSPGLAAQASGQLMPYQDLALGVGPDPADYVHVQSERHQNIYRIPLH